MMTPLSLGEGLEVLPSVFDNERLSLQCADEALNLICGQTTPLLKDSRYLLTIAFYFFVIRLHTRADNATVKVTRFF